jgi:ubiquinone/menaquinone biosynthesis C-methylase UbiE
MQTKWEIAQENELKSWVKTDIDHDFLIEIWQERMSQIGLKFEEINQGKKILDIGCGPVLFLHIIPKTNLMVAADPLNDAYKQNLKFPRKEYIVYENFLAEKIPYEDEKFDMIFCLNALDHMVKPKEALFEIMRVLNYNGFLYLEFENTSPLFKFLTKFRYKKPLAEFHPHIITTQEVIKYIIDSKYKFKITMMKSRPQFSFNKVKYLFKLIFKRKKRTTYEKTVSSLSYGKFSFILHHILILIERMLYIIWPWKYSYFVNLVIQKI